MVLIGPQSGGKSTIAKLLAIFKNIEFVVKSFQYPNENHFQASLIEFGITEYDKKSTYIEYHSLLYSITVKDKLATVQLNPNFSDLLKLVADGEKLMKYKIVDSKMVFDTEPKADAVASIYANAYIHQSIYIPAERILFSTLSDSLYSLLANDVVLPKLFLKFGGIIERARRYSPKIDIKTLSVTYLRDNNQDWILQNGKKIKISHTSSGIQTSIPLFLAIHQEHGVDYLKNFIVEEPELNLYPITQKQLVDFLAERCVNEKNSLLVTTHSPYILSAFANLIKANEVAKISDEKKAKTKKVVPEKYWIDYNETSAYFIDKGVSKNIMDKKFKTIDFSQIDKASDVIGNEFDKLLSIQFED